MVRKPSLRSVAATPGAKQIITKTETIARETLRLGVNRVNRPSTRRNPSAQIKP